MSNAITRMIKVLEILYLLCGLDPLLTVKFPVGLAILTKLDSPDMCDLADESDQLSFGRPLPPNGRLLPQNGRPSLVTRKRSTVILTEPQTPRFP